MENNAIENNVAENTAVWETVKYLNYVTGESKELNVITNPGLGEVVACSRFAVKTAFEVEDDGYAPEMDDFAIFVAALTFFTDMDVKAMTGDEIWAMYRDTNAPQEIWVPKLSRVNDMVYTGFAKRVSKLLARRGSDDFFEALGALVEKINTDVLSKDNVKRINTLIKKVSKLPVSEDTVKLLGESIIKRLDGDESRTK